MQCCELFVKAAPASTVNFLFSIRVVDLSEKCQYSKTPLSLLDHSALFSEHRPRRVASEPIDEAG